MGLTPSRLFTSNVNGLDTPKVSGVTVHVRYRYEMGIFTSASFRRALRHTRGILLLNKSLQIGRLFQSPNIVCFQHFMSSVTK